MIFHSFVGQQTDKQQIIQMYIYKNAFVWKTKKKKSKSWESIGVVLFFFVLPAAVAIVFFSKSDFNHGHIRFIQ